jgi:Leucine-rich repeat (LRR) protein
VQLIDLAPLGALRSLVSLDVSHNRLTRVLDFSPPPSLRRADLSHNLIEELNDVSAHRALRWLDLSDNRIAAIAGVRRCALLEALRLDRNRVAAVGGLHALPLRELSLRGNCLASLLPPAGEDGDDPHAELLDAVADNLDIIRPARPHSSPNLHIFPPIHPSIHPPTHPPIHHPPSFTSPHPAPPLHTP